MTTETPKLTRAEQTQRTREEIRAAAIDLIESKGFDATTIDDIAEAAGVGRRTFFRHFPCKEAVLFSSGIFGNLLQDFSELLDAGTPPMLALIEGIKRDASTTQNPDATTVRRRKLRVALLTHPTVSSYYRTAIADFADAIADVVREHAHRYPERLLPEVIRGLMYTMALQHVESGETHHFTGQTSEDEWRAALLAVERSFGE